MPNFSLISQNEDQTKEIARIISETVKLGDIIILEGDLGTGKTFFVKAFTAALVSANPVSSPTFTIANFYNTESGTLIHIDAYRLSGIAEFRDLGLYDYFPESIVLIEWGGKLIDEFEDYLRISFEYFDTHSRQIKISYAGERWASVFDKIISHLS